MKSGHFLLLLLLCTVYNSFCQTSNATKILVTAKPKPISIVAEKTAVIVVDMENDFSAKGGMLDRMGVDISSVQKTIAPTARVLATARKMGLKIIYLKMAFQPNLSDLGDSTSLNSIIHSGVGVGKDFIAPDESKSRILIRDTWSTDIVAGLQPQDSDIIVYKNRFSGFYQTDLDSIY